MLRKGQVYSHPDTSEPAGYPSHSPSPLPPLLFRTQREAFQPQVKELQKGMLRTNTLIEQHITWLFWNKTCP